MYPIDELPFALLHFSAGQLFNRKLRYYAKRYYSRAKGHYSYSLSDHGLVPVLVYKGKSRKEDGSYNDNKEKIGRSEPCATEADIFRFLDLPYRAPTERSTWYGQLPNSTDDAAAARAAHAASDSSDGEAMAEDEEEDDDDEPPRGAVVAAGL